MTDVAWFRHREPPAPPDAVTEAVARVRQFSDDLRAALDVLNAMNRNTGQNPPGVPPRKAPP